MLDVVEKARPSFISHAHIPSVIRSNTVTFTSTKTDLNPSSGTSSRNSPEVCVHLYFAQYAQRDLVYVIVIVIDNTTSIIKFTQRAQILGVGKLRVNYVTTRSSHA